MAGGTGASNAIQHRPVRTLVPVDMAVMTMRALFEHTHTPARQTADTLPPRRLILIATKYYFKHRALNQTGIGELLLDVRVIDRSSDQTRDAKCDFHNEHRN
jgi:hypothetical protein